MWSALTDIENIPEPQVDSKPLDKTSSLDDMHVPNAPGRLKNHVTTAQQQLGLRNTGMMAISSETILDALGHTKDQHQAASVQHQLRLEKTTDMSLTITDNVPTEQRHPKDQLVQVSAGALKALLDEVDRLKKENEEMKNGRDEPKFTRFGKLPAELRIKVWGFALGTEEVFVIDLGGSDYHRCHHIECRCPPLKSSISMVCNESATEARKVLLLKPASGWGPSHTNLRAIFNPSADVAWMIKYNQLWSFLDIFDYRPLNLGVKRLAIDFEDWVSAEDENLLGHFSTFYEFMGIGELIFVVASDTWSKGGYPVKFIVPRHPPSHYPKSGWGKDREIEIDTWEAKGKQVMKEMQRWLDKMEAWQKRLMNG